MTNLVPDINLKRIINEYLLRPKETNITKVDLEHITTYIYSDSPSPGYYINNLEGLQYAINMTELLIENDLLSNMTPLTNLQKLNTLFLNNNLIKIIPNLSKMTNLSSLLLNSNEIKDISPIATSKNLRVLKINNNMISDLSSLSSMENLIEYHVLNQEINIQDVKNTSCYYTLDIAFLKDINGEIPTCIEPFHKGKYYQDLTQITWPDTLLKSENPSFTFSNKDKSFTGVVTVEIVDLDHAIYIEDKILENIIIEVLNITKDIITRKDMLKLRTLDLTNKGIESLKGLEYAQNLYTLILDGNYVTNFEYIPPSVTYLSIKNFKNEILIPDEKLKFLINITLHRGDNDIISLNNIKNLTILDETNSHIKSLDGLQYAENLKIISLLNNHISDIKPLSQLNNITFLDLSGNNLSDLSPLSSIYKNINYIYAYNQNLLIEKTVCDDSNIFELSLSFLKDIDGNFITNILPSHKGNYLHDKNSIVWKLDFIPSNVTFYFSGVNNIFNGTVYVELINENNKNKVTYLNN